MTELKTKSQMIMRIANLSEENTLLREQLYNKSETEQALQTALEENQKLTQALKVIRQKVVHASTQWDTNEYNMIIRELVRTIDYIDGIVK